VCRAAKFEEQPNNVPTLSQLANQNDGMHTKARLIEAEKLVQVHPPRAPLCELCGGERGNFRCK
jgi:hypothetical protein